MRVIIVDRSGGEIRKRFYLWDDYILDEYRKKLKRALDMGKKMNSCSYCAAFTGFFTDECDNFYLSFIDTKADHLFYQFSISGELLQVYKVDFPGASGVHFFQYKDNTFYAYTRYGIHLFKAAH